MQNPPGQIAAGLADIGLRVELLRMDCARHGPHQPDTGFRTGTVMPATIATQCPHNRWGRPVELVFVIQRTPLEGARRSGDHSRISWPQYMRIELCIQPVDTSAAGLRSIVSPVSALQLPKGVAMRTADRPRARSALGPRRAHSHCRSWVRENEEHGQSPSRSAHQNFFAARPARYLVYSLLRRESNSQRADVAKCSQGEATVPLASDGCASLVILSSRLTTASAA